VRVARIQIRELRAKWASMATAGNLTLSRKLLALPRNLGEYVIVHELVHLLAPNHGKVFKSFMRAYLPDWEERERCERMEETCCERPRDRSDHHSLASDTFKAWQPHPRVVESI
jgi:hypothetical protein